MAQHLENRTIGDAVELLKTNSFDGLAEAVTVLLNSAMVVERSEYLRAAPYERSAERTGYANGYKDKAMKTRLGTLPLKVPQTRDSEFYPQSLERGLRSERALLLAIAEMYVQGVSTRRVKKIVEELCGMEISSTQVSRAAAELDELLEAWRCRDLDRYPYLVLDARYEKVRQGGQVLDAAVLIACGVDDQQLNVSDLFLTSEVAFGESIPCGSTKINQARFPGTFSALWRIVPPVELSD